MLDHIRPHLREEPPLNVENNAPQPLLIHLQVLTKIGRHGRAGQVKREITGVNQLPIVRHAPYLIGLNDHVPIGVQVADIVFQAAAGLVPIAETNAGFFQHLAGPAALAHFFHPLGGILAGELVQFVVAAAQLGPRILAAGFLQGGFGQGLNGLHGVQR